MIHGRATVPSEKHVINVNSEENDGIGLAVNVDADVGMNAFESSLLEDLVK